VGKTRPRSRERPPDIDPELARRGLQIFQDPRFSRREWIFERAMWALMLLFVVAAAFGVFGGGPLSDGRAATPDGRMEIRYDRFLRYQTPTSVVVTLQRLGPEEQAIHLLVSQSLLQNFRLGQTSPQPQEIAYERGSIRYTFPIARGETQLVVRFELEPDTFGTQETHVSRAGGGAVLLRQFVWL
jgi:hypothetical protein